MIYLLAWVVVGYCCYRLNKQRRGKYLPIHHAGMLCLLNEKRNAVTAEKIVACSKSVEVVIMFCCVALSPVSLYFEVAKATFSKKKAAEKILRYKSICDEFVKIHGNIL
jgi:hypothetical protein